MTRPSAEPEVRFSVRLRGEECTWLYDLRRKRSSPDGRLATVAQVVREAIALANGVDMALRLRQIAPDGSK